MKRNTKSRLAFLLALLSLISTLSACGGDGSQTSDTTAADAGDTTAPTETADPRLAIDDGLPEIDLEGYEFRVMPSYFGKTPTVPLYAPDESSGDIIDDSIYDRNRRVEERFNCKIVEIDAAITDWQQHTNFIKQFVLAGDDTYDVTMNHIIGGPNISLDGVFMNFYDLKYIDFSKPWWSSQMVDEMTVRGQAYMVADTLGLGALKSAKVLYLNKGKFAEYKLDLPYEDVFAGEWYMEDLDLLTKDIYEDVNGNSERDVNDFYGYVSHASQNGWLVSSDCSVLEKDPDKTLKIVANSERVATLVEKVYKLYYENEGSLIVRGNDPETGVSQSDWQAQLFADGHALVGFSTVNTAATVLRQSNVEYGIIPFPKFDANQEVYRTFCGGNLVGVPVTVQNPDKTSLILEALTAESYKTVVPAFFGTALKEKFTYDSESGQSLDIINDSLTISFAYAYDNWKGFGHMMGSILSTDTPSADFSSFYASRITSAETRLKLITDFFEANE